MKARLRTSRGFTIIEVLIVLAIAALILLLVLFVIPTAARTERNHSRKQFVNLTIASLEEYTSSQGLGYPDTPAQMCQFILNYLTKTTGGGGTCSPSYMGLKDCVLVKTDRYDICYHSRTTSSHAYIGPEDEISIQLGHWCTSGLGVTPTPGEDPITSGTDMHDDNVRRYVIWTKLEPSGIYCRDNYPVYP